VPLVLGIETSCDETSAAVLDGTGDDVAQRSLVILSQDVHRIFGGVVPEIASRAHLTAIVPVVERALADAGATLADVDAVAVTHAPGLVGALLVGVSYGKALAYARGAALVGVHHMEGHLFAPSLEHRDAVPPFTALLVSGGHTLLVDAPAWGEYRLLGATRDDAAGEAFDKVAKLLGLPYPGGRHVEALARDGDPSRLRLARPMLRANQQPGDPDYYDVSFSGLKTAVLNAVRAAGLDADGADPPRAEREVAPSAASPQPGAALTKADVARAFQDALVETLVEKTFRAARDYGRTRVVLGGGVACNRTLVQAMRDRLEGRGVSVFAPTPRLATDNAAMIARAGLFRYERGERSGWELNAYASRELPGMVR
jgi:N6-L-threonylcarbamoyladenine synthase